MIEKIDKLRAGIAMLDRPTAYHLIIDKINEIIDYINEYPIMTTPVETKSYTITRTEVDND